MVERILQVSLVQLKLPLVAVNVVVGMMLLVAGDCLAQQLPRSPVIEEVVLDNGCRVLFQPNNSASTVAISALVGVQASQETRLTAGIRQLLALIVAAPDPWPKQIGPCPPSLRLEASANRDGVALRVECLPQDLTYALALIRHQLFEAQISQESFERARHQLSRTIQTNRQLPLPVAFNTVVKELYPSQAGSWPVTGLLASMSTISVERTRQFYRDHFRPNVTVISISGNAKLAALKAKTEELFGELLPGPEYHGERFTPHPKLSGPRRLMMRGLDKSVVVTAGRAPAIGDPQYPAAVVLSALIGSGMGSRLYQALRAEQSLAYTVEAALTPSVVCGYSYIIATCSRSDIDAVRTEIARQLVDIASNSPTQPELERAKRFVINSFLLSQQRNRDVAHYLGVFSNSSLVKGLSTYRDFSQLSAEVSGDQVRNSCAQIFSEPATVIIDAISESQPAVSSETRVKPSILQPAAKVTVQTGN